MPLKTIIIIGETGQSFSLLHQWLFDYRIVPILDKDWQHIEKYIPGLVLFHASDPIERSLSRLANQDWLKRLPTLLIHGQEQPSSTEIAMAYNYGIVDCIAWPTDQQSVREKVSAHFQATSWLKRLLHGRNLGLRRTYRAGIVPAHPMMQRRLSKPSDNITAKGLYVQFFGAFQLYYDQEKLPNQLSNKNKNILAYFLYHQGKFLHREKLMDLFWPQVGPDAARNSLHVAISQLRAYLRPFLGAGKILKHQNEGYLFDPDCGVISDVQQFQANCRSGWDAMKTAQMEAAIPYLNKASDLYQMEFLREFLYEDWCSREREALQEALLAILKSLALHYHQQRLHERVIPLAERMLLIAPFLEDIHRLLIACYLALNMRGRALNQYQKCSALLLSHFGVEPSPETQALIAEVRTY